MFQKSSSLVSTIWLQIQNDIDKIGLCLDKEVPELRLLTGEAGTGKTYAVKKRCLTEKGFGLLTATTGIAAINLDTRTVNSQLKYFDTKALRELYLNCKLHDKLNWIRENYKYLIIEESSMLPNKQGDIIVEAVSDVNYDQNKKLGIIFVGDFCQLPPVYNKNDPNSEPVDFLFNSNFWNHSNIQNNILKLTKVFRQDNVEFVKAINHARRGNGKDCYLALSRLGVKFQKDLDTNFNGTTIAGTNQIVDDFNFKLFNQIKSPVIRINPTRRGKQLPEWDKYIPIEQRFKINCYVMILTNDIENWEYVNGDCGWVTSYNKGKNHDDDYVTVKLKRNNKLVRINRITRLNLMENEPPQSYFSSMFAPQRDYQSQLWIIGKIIYHPLRLAYASTVHKSQGLTLDKVQLDIRSYNMNDPAMVYVGLSRVKSHEDLVIVGKPEDFINKIKIDSRVRQWV
jgi:ATP-dependent DNA helicase PIF1